MKKFSLLVIAFLALALPGFSLSTSGRVSSADTVCAAAIGPVCVTQQVPQTNGSSTQAVAIQLVSVSFNGTVQFEGTIDGTTWVAITGFPLGSNTGATSATSGGLWRFATAGIIKVRVRASTVNAGAMLVFIQSSYGRFDAGQ